jgi:hypothetical protein
MLLSVIGQGQVITTFYASGAPPTPTVTTNDVGSITQTGASCGGNVTSDGGFSVTARGVCWSTSQNPTTSNSKTEDGTGTGPFTSSITGLTHNTTYYVRAYATNEKGTTYGSQKTFSALPAVGDTYGGGVLFYTANSGANGYVSATSDQATNIGWDQKESAISGADGTAIGTGEQNTADIVAVRNSYSNAAKLCNDLSLNGYTDWFLPSTGELTEVYSQRNSIGNFSTTISSYYWTSTEHDLYQAKIVLFYNGSVSYLDRTSSIRVRCIRYY